VKAPAPRDRLTTRIITVLAIAAAGVTLFQLSRPGLLFGVTPDISVYVGGAVRLVHGAVPYRDFVFVQPPGFVLLATPVAFLSELIGTRDALALLRLLTPVLAAANVVLVGRLVRHQGRAATLVACAVMALFPGELYAIRGPQLEPVLVLLCLLGAVLVYNGDTPADSRRLAFGGLAFGFAVAVKTTAVLPLIVLVVLLAPQWRRRLLPFIGGAAAGLGIPTLPFLLLAPAAFLRDTVATQLGRIPASGRVPLPVRLGDLTGLSAFGAPDAVTIALAIAIGGFVIVAFAVSRRPPTTLEWFALGSTVAVGLAQLAPALYYQQYAAFMAPFLAAALGVSVGRLAGLRPGRLAMAAAAVLVVALLTAQLVYVASESVPDVARSVDAVVPAGGCALSNSPVFLFTADRFQAASPGCTAMTDPYGTTLALGDSSAEAIATWNTAFAKVDYVVTDVPIDAWQLPPNAHLAAYVAANFRLLRSGGLLFYVRHGFTA
jgi:alpha-1,2-mannosyltransferase